MAVNPSAFGPKPQYVDVAGNPAIGYKLFFYVAGSTSTKQDTFTDSTGLVANTNPIILNALGEPNTQIWWPAGRSFKVVLAPPTDTDPPTSPIWTIDNLYGINDFTNAPAQSEWVLSPLTPAFVNATTFTLLGNQTSDFQVGRRIKSTNTAGQSYGTILASVFTTLTTVTLTNTSGVLDSGLSQVSYGLLSAVNPSIPQLFASIGSLLINGNFNINQRAYVSGAATVGANQYTLDRWRVVTSGQSLTFAASGNGNLVTAPAGGVEQVVEGANIGSAAAVINWVGTATCTVDGVAKTKGAAVTLVPGTNCTVRFTGGTVSQAQLEYGLIPMSFQFRQISDELVLCQRYYEVLEIGLLSNSPTTAATAGTGSFLVTKRIAPTPTRLGGGLGGFTAPDTITVTVNSYYFSRAAIQSGGSYAFSAEI